MPRRHLRLYLHYTDRHHVRRTVWAYSMGELQRYITRHRIHGVHTVVLHDGTPMGWVHYP